MSAATMERAAVERCTNVDPRVMFPSRDLPNDHPAVVHAKQVCAGCPFLADCREDAIARREPEGVFGALTAKERFAVIRRRNRAAQKVREAREAAEAARQAAAEVEWDQYGQGMLAVAW